MKWIASLLLVLILALAVFVNVSTVSALPGGRTPLPTASGTPISVGTTPHP